jgi:hypothetical protein
MEWANELDGMDMGDYGKMFQINCTTSMSFVNILYPIRSLAF